MRNGWTAWTVTALVLATLTMDAMAVARTWTGSTATWTDSDNTKWDTAAPTTNDVVNLMQVTASDITVTYDGNQILGLTGTETNAGTRFGTVTLSNSGGGTTTLAIAAGDVLPFTGDGNVNVGGRLQVDGGLYSPDSSMNVYGGRVVQSGGLIKPLYYDLRLASGGEYEINGGTSSFRRVMMSIIVEGQGAYGSAILRITGGKLQLNNVFYIGEATNTSSATVIQTGGQVHTGGWNINLYGSNSLYRLEGGICFPTHAYIYGGVFIQTNNAVCSNVYDWAIGQNSGQSGVYRLCGGSFFARGLYLGDNGGTGLFVQAGGTLASWTATVPQYIGGTNGSGTYLLGDANGPATNVVAGNFSTRVYPTGTFRGHGLVLGPYWNNLYMSGRVIADGYGAESDLDFANAADQRFWSTAADGKFIINTYDNPASGSNGWFAVNKGRLKPPIVGSNAGWYVNNTRGTTFNWCESVYGDDSEIDLINSAQFVFAGLGAANGKLTGYLLATGRTDVAAAPIRRIPLSVHEFSLAVNTFTSHTLTIRYDTTAIAALRRVREESVQIWQYTGAAWAPVTSSMDIAKKLVSTTSLTTLGKFMVTIDEPASGTIIMLK